MDPIGLFYYTGPTGSSQTSSSTPVTPHEPTGPTGPTGTMETPRGPETPVLSGYNGVPPQYRQTLEKQREKHKNDDVRPDTPYNQLSPELSDIYGMKEGGCYFMCTLFVAQNSEGKNLTANEIRTIINKSKLDASLGNDLTVNNPDKTTNRAFGILGSGKTATYNWNQKIINGLPQSPDYSISKGITSNNNPHFTVLFNYDPYTKPYSYNSNSENKLEVIPVYIHGSN